MNRKPDILRALMDYAKDEKTQQPYERNDEQWGYYQYTSKEHKQARKFLLKIVEGQTWIVKDSDWLDNEDKDAARHHGKLDRYNKFFPEVTEEEPDPQGGPDSDISTMQTILIKGVVSRDMNLVQRVLDQVEKMRGVLVSRKYDVAADPGLFIEQFTLIENLCRKWAFERGPSSSVISALREQTEAETKAYNLVLEDAEEQLRNDRKVMSALDIFVATKVRYQQLKDDMTAGEIAAEQEAMKESYKKAEQDALKWVANLEDGGQLFRSYNLELVTKDILQRILQLMAAPRFVSGLGKTTDMFTFADLKKLIDAGRALAHEIVQRSFADVERQDDKDRNALQLGINELKRNLRRRIDELEHYLWSINCC